MATEFRGEDYEDNFISSLVSFVAGEKFQTMFEEFFVAHALEFTNEKEHKLRYHELYMDFSKMFERQLEVFCADLNMSHAQFMKRCKEASTEDPKAKHYIDILLSSVEYDTFVKLMRLMRPLAAHRIQEKAESKGVDRDSAVDKEIADSEEFKAEGKFSEGKQGDSKAGSK
eukprot:gene38376-46641_t